MLDNNHIEAHGPAQPFAATRSPQPKKGESHFRITRAYREYWQPRLKPASWSLLTVLISHIYKTGDVYPSHPLLAIEANMSIKSVQRHLGYLRDAGAIWWEPRYRPTLKGKNKQTSNRYYFGQNDQHPQSDLTSTPQSESPTKDIEKREVKKKDIVVDFKKSSYDVEPSERPLTEKETKLVRQLLDLDVEGPVARKYVTERPDVVERQLYLFQFHAKSRTTEAAHIVHNIQHDWPDPRLKRKADSAPSLQSTPTQIDRASHDHRQASGQATTKQNRPVSRKSDTGKTVTVQESQKSAGGAGEPQSNIRLDALRCHAVFQTLSADEQTELMELAKKAVNPCWHDRVGLVESPMSLGLWKLVAERYSEVLK